MTRTLSKKTARYGAGSCVGLVVEVVGAVAAAAERVVVLNRDFAEDLGRGTTGCVAAAGRCRRVVGVGTAARLSAEATSLLGMRPLVGCVAGFVGLVGFAGPVAGDGVTPPPPNAPGCFTTS